MERGSDKHSSRVDEQLEGEVQSLVKGEPSESRAEEFRQLEGLPERDPDLDEELPEPETGEGAPDQGGPPAEGEGEPAEPGEPEAGPEAGGPPA